MMIHKRLQKLRMQQGFSQKEMAEKLHKSTSAYSRIEKGEIKIALEELPKIAEILSCSLEDLMQDLATINIQQHNENAYAHHILEQNNGITEITQLFQQLMEHQTQSELRMQEFMKEIIKSLKK